MIRWLARNWFLGGLLAAVGLAFLWPAPGAQGGVLRPEVTTRLAVAVIFLLQGLVLALDALREGLARWRLHVLVQAFTYLVFPLLGLALDAVAGRFLSDELRLGFLFLAVLPTTISSAVVFTALAGGNTAGALVNATISNLLGVIVTPLWVGALLQVRGESFALWSLVWELVLLVLLPLFAGQIVRPLVRELADRSRARVGQINSGIVLFIVYAAFCESVRSDVWTRQGWAPVVQAVAGSSVLFVVVLALTLMASRWMRLVSGDRVAALFCAPQKTLAAGAPMANLIFATHPALGVILLPVICYHPLQLLASGLLVGWLRRTTEAGNFAPPPR